MNHSIKCRFTVIAIMIGGLFNGIAGPTTAQQTVQPPVDFNRDIKPLLSDRCFLCHGPDAGSREADLRLDLEDDARNVIAAGSPEDSELFLRITSDDDEQMPPKDSKLSLSNHEIQLIKRWIDEGAKWEQHWAFVAPEKHPAPTTKKTQAQIGNEIDSFVLARLDSEGTDPSLYPAPRATREKRLRRISFDLTGLPPTIAELDAFLADESPEAYEKAVDRLLASTSYGERMASDWLDLARYSDTYGYQVDRDRFVWPWRDWVVRAFNQNMPYDQFITQQLAGDLLPEATDDQILATTFNRLHPQKVEGGSVEEEFRVEYVADRSQTVGMAFLGLTVECARCHDHKYDPLSQKEYYQLFAFFNNIDEAGLYSFFDASAVPTPTLLISNEVQKRTLAELRSAVSTAEQHIAEYKKAASSKFDRWLNEELETRDLADLAIPGLTLHADFEKTNNAGNRLVDGTGGAKAIQLTGDDEVRLDTGRFQRHQPFTIATRVNVPDDPQLQNRSVIFHRSRAWTDSASRGYQLLIKDGRLNASLIHFWPGNAISIQTTEPVATQQWVHVALTYDGSSSARGLKLFLNGRPVSTEIVRDNLQKTIVGSGTDHLVLGARFRDVGFKNGQLTDFRVFDRKLTELEIGALDNNDQSARLLTQPVNQLTEQERSTLLEYFLHTQDSEFAERLAAVAAARKQLNQAINKLPEIMVMREMPQPRPTFLLERGAYDAPTAPVTAGTPAVFPPLTNGTPNRLALAKWLTSGSHPLTARVAVNHYWQLLFGNGLVRTPEDFGSQGQPPTHPKLLDTLAVDFQENGWDVKRLLKKIVMSSTYQQSTATSQKMLELDPENRLLARSPTFRLPAEMIRDNVLATSGLLVNKLGGAPVRPYELAVSFKPSTPDKGEGLYRRSLYTYWKRTGPAPVMLTLDSAKRDVCQVKRERTSSPLAALVQLNNPQTVEASRILAEKLLQRHGDDQKAIIVDLFRLLTSRFPSNQEASILASLYENQRSSFQMKEAAAKQFLEVGESKSQTNQPLNLAAWASVVNTMFSFDECVMKR